MKRLRLMLVLLILSVMAVPFHSISASAATASAQKIAIKLTYPTNKVKVGGTISLKAVMQPKAVALTYVSNSSKVATVSSQGVVTGKSVGKATITAKVNQKGYTGLASVVVEVTAGTTTAANASDLRVVTFRDPSLEAVVRGMIAKPQGNILGKDVSKIEKIDGKTIDRYAPGRIRDLTGIEALSSLKSIDLTNNLVADLRPLAKLARLQELDLDNNKVQDLSPLSSLPKLEYLSLNRNFISDISALSKVTTLKGISIANNTVKDLGPLRSLANLESVDATSNVISDIQAINKLSKLKEFYLWNNPILDTAPAARVTYHGAYDLKTIQQAGQEAHAIVDKIIKPGMSDLQKEEAIHDYLLGRIAYDYSYFFNNKPTKTDPNGIYGALIEGYSVCEGYAQAMKILGQLAGLDVLNISGVSTDGVGHAWNLVRIDGSYRHLDATWDDGDPWKENGSAPSDNRMHFNLTQNERLHEARWDVDLYPAAKTDADLSSAGSQRLKVAVNSEIAMESDRLVLLKLDLRYKSSGTQYIKDYETASTYKANAKTLETEFVIPAEVPLSSGEVEYTLTYELYEFGTSIFPDFIRASDTFLFNGNGIMGSIARGTLKSGAAPLQITLLKKGSKGVTFAQAGATDLKDALNTDSFELYIQNAYPQSNGTTYNQFALRNVSSFTLPAYSAIYVTAGLNTRPFDESDYYNYHFGGKLVIANHTSEPKTIQAKQIDFSLLGIYSDNYGTLTKPDGTSIKEVSTGPYVRLISFDGDFDESVPYSDYADKNLIRYSGDWLTVPSK